MEQTPIDPARKAGDRRHAHEPDASLALLRPLDGDEDLRFRGQLGRLREMGLALGKDPNRPWAWGDLLITVFQDGLWQRAFPDKYPTKEDFLSFVLDHSGLGQGKASRTSLQRFITLARAYTLVQYEGNLRKGIKASHMYIISAASESLRAGLHVLAERRHTVGELAKAAQAGVEHLVARAEVKAPVDPDELLEIMEDAAMAERAARAAARRCPRCVARGEGKEQAARGESPEVARWQQELGEARARAAAAEARAGQAEAEVAALRRQVEELQQAGAGAPGAGAGGPDTAAQIGREGAGAQASVQAAAAPPAQEQVEAPEQAVQATGQAAHTMEQAARPAAPEPVRAAARPAAGERVSFTPVVRAAWSLAAAPRQRLEERLCRVAEGESGEDVITELSDLAGLLLLAGAPRTVLEQWLALLTQADGERRGAFALWFLGRVGGPRGLPDRLAHAALPAGLRRMVDTQLRQRPAAPAPS